MKLSVGEIKRIRLVGDIPSQVSTSCSRPATWRPKIEANKMRSSLIAMRPVCEMKIAAEPRFYSSDRTREEIDGSLRWTNRIGRTTVELASCGCGKIILAYKNTLAYPGPPLTAVHLLLCWRSGPKVQSPGILSFWKLVGKNISGVKLRRRQTEAKSLFS